MTRIYAAAARITSGGRQGRDRVCVGNERTFDKRGLQIWRPNDLAFALHCLPALAASDDGLDSVIDAGGRGDGVGKVVSGRDVYMLGEVVAVIGSHVCRVRASGCSAAAGCGGRDGAGGRGRTEEGGGYYIGYMDLGRTSGRDSKRDFDSRRDAEADRRVGDSRSPERGESQGFG